MNKIIPFKKEIIFKTNIKEITSISLEHTLSLKEGNVIKGNFIISGDYKMLDTSVNKEDFSYEIPFTACIDENYILDDIKIDIDDFYYEVINDNILEVNIDVKVDNIKEKELEEKTRVIEELPIESGNEELEQEKRCIEDENLSISNVTDLFETDDSNSYRSYTVYIVRENDTIESIMTKYAVKKEELELYNDLSEIKIGDKIIIPAL